MYKHTTLSSPEFSQFPHQTSLLPSAGIFLYLCFTSSDKPRFGLFWGLWVPGTPHHPHFRDPCLPIITFPTEEPHAPPACTIHVQSFYTLATQPQLSRMYSMPFAGLQLLLEGHLNKTKQYENGRICQICTPAATREHEGFLHILLKVFWWWKVGS